jgi:restriction endonuclease S subunit
LRFWNPQNDWLRINIWKWRQAKAFSLVTNYLSTSCAVAENQIKNLPITTPNCEQERIVERLEELLPLCEKLE